MVTAAMKLKDTPWKKSYDKSRQHIKKQKDISLLTKVHLVKAMVFPVVMYGCESWTIRKAECWRIDAFKLWCWRRLMRVPWTAGRTNQSILMEISPEHSLEGLMLKLKLQYFGHLLRRTDSLEKTWCWERLKARGEGDDRGGDGWMTSLTQWTWVWVSSRCWGWTRKPGMLQSMESQRVRHYWGTEVNWTDLGGIKTAIWVRTFQVPQEFLLPPWTVKLNRNFAWLFSDCKLSGRF